MARRYLELHDEVAGPDDKTGAIVKDLAPDLLAKTAIGLSSAARIASGGDRLANSAIHIIDIGHRRLGPRSRNYVAKRTAAGHSKLEAMRCLKRYIAREVFGIIMKRQRSSPPSPGPTG